MQFNTLCPALLTHEKFCYVIQFMYTAEAELEKTNIFTLSAKCAE